MDATLELLKSRRSFCRLNPDYGKPAGPLPCTKEEIFDTEARLVRFAPLLAELFDEAAEHAGIIESELLEIPRLSRELLPGAKMLLKADHDLPVAGSIKARGGIYNVLCFAEKLCLDRGLLTFSDNYRRLVEELREERGEAGEPGFRVENFLCGAGQGTCRSAVIGVEPAEAPPFFQKFQSCVHKPSFRFSSLK